MSVTRYVIVGIWNSFFGISIFILLSLLLKDGNSILILCLSYVIATLQAHFSQRRFVWKSESKYLPELFKFCSFYLLQFFLNSILLVIMNSWLETPREVNQILIIFILTLVFFYINKNGVFNVRNREIQH
jgi:putative flippase GtrA